MVYIVIRPKNGVPYVSNFCEDYMEARCIAAQAVRKDTDVDLFQGIPYKEGTTKEEIAEKLEKDSQPILHLWQNLDEAVWLGCPYTQGMALAHQRRDAPFRGSLPCPHLVRLRHHAERHAGTAVPFRETQEARVTGAMKGAYHAEKSLAARQRLCR